MRTFSLKISASLAFALIASQAFAHAQLEKACSAGRRNGRLGERDPAHLQRRRRAEIHQGFRDRSGRGRAAWGGENGIGQPGRADRADHERARRRRIQSSLAGGVGRHPPHAGNFRIHGEAMMAGRGKTPANRGRRLNGQKGHTMRHSLFTLALAFAISAAPALAQKFKAGDIVIESPWARATPKGAQVGSGYLTIENTGAVPDRLTGGTADFATVEIHQMTAENAQAGGGGAQPLGHVGLISLARDRSRCLPLRPFSWPRC